MCIVTNIRKVCPDTKQSINRFSSIMETESSHERMMTWINLWLEFVESLRQKKYDILKQKIIMNLSQNKHNWSDPKVKKAMHIIFSIAIYPIILYLLAFPLKRIRFTSIGEHVGKNDDTPAEYHIPYFQNLYDTMVKHPGIANTSFNNLYVCFRYMELILKVRNYKDRSTLLPRTLRHYDIANLLSNDTILYYRFMVEVLSIFFKNAKRLNLINDEHFHLEILRHIIDTVKTNSS